MDEDEYGDIADEDLIEAFSQASQTLPPLPSPKRAKRAKRRRPSGDYEVEDVTLHRRRRSCNFSEDGVSSDKSSDYDDAKLKKNKYKIHVGDQDVPAAKILGATQADALPDSSPYRIRGPIYKKPRPEVPIPPYFAAPSAPASNHASLSRQTSSQIYNDHFDQELDIVTSDVPSLHDVVTIESSQLNDSQQGSVPRQRLVAPVQGLRQTTLFGGRAQNEVSASQAKKVHNFIVDQPPEAPTHHVLNYEALKSWIYPTNLGKIRDYQYSIVRQGLFHNTLVALPTGLGKTFIAAIIMYNFFRWTKDAQIVFVAPTKPLVAQQVDACFNIVGIPKSQTTMLTGEQPPALRAEEWQDKRVFFMTPQTLENDLSSGIADPKKIVLLVVDEAHRATGNYAYVKVVNFLRRFNKSFRVLALTATPGASVEAVQEVVDGLEISKVEIRTEESIDIQQYVHKRNIDQILLDPSDEMIMIKDLFAKSLQPLVNLLCSNNAYWNKDPMALTPFGMMQARKGWFASGAGKAASPGLKGMMHSLFSTLGSLAHSIKLLNFHGIGPFYSTIKEFRQNGEDAKNGGGKYRKQILEHPDFRKMMDRIQMWINKDDFVGHPKLTYLCDTILNHFLDAGERRLGENSPPSSTRVIVFAEFRDSAEDINRVLNRHGPMIRASVFVGQADSKRSEGMNQAKQQQTIDSFKSGKINVLVATSIGEEGLDIGQVDLIVCYDASGSPIRMLQRMGRTGRKRAGNITLLLMRGKEEENFAKAKDNYEQMQKMISSGARFNFRHDLSVRILPRDIVPEVDKRHIEIPIENTQDPSLPEPKRRRVSKIKKKPPKKFHMPDGVETGFQKASKLADQTLTLTDLVVTVKPKEVTKPHCVPIPLLTSVLLDSPSVRMLEKRYQNVAGDEIQEVSMPEMTAHPLAQRSLGPVDKVPHGQYTKRCVTLFQNLAKSQCVEDRYYRPYGDIEPVPLVWSVPALVEDENQPKKVFTKKTTALGKDKGRSKHILNLLDTDDEDSELVDSSVNQQHTKGESDPLSENDTEGEGDDLLNSEEPSEDESDASESLNGFIVSTAHQSSTLDTSPVGRSLTFQTPINGNSSRHHIIDLATSDNGLSGGSASSHNRPSFQVNELVSDEQAQPALGRRKRNRIVEESDSDE